MNKEKMVSIKWQDDFTTESCMKYYGQHTRNEYRITRFGRNFPFLQDENTGDLLIIAKQSEDNYSGYVLSSDEDIDGFFAYFNLTPDRTNQLIDTTGIINANEDLDLLIQDFVADLDTFPESNQMASGAQNCFNKAYHITELILKDKPDDILLKWINTEFQIFKCIEKKVYSHITSQPFNDIDTFIQTANEVLNRRKSRAGKSLEHHLSKIFTINGLIFEEQAATEDHKKPDFLFPNGKCYHDFLFPTENLTVLGAKTTCKDRWRQVLTEANRIDSKHLFTLQQGISKNQLKEMQDAKLTLVVPLKYKSNFPKEYQDKILDLRYFLQIVKEKQERMPKHYLFG